MIYFADAGRSCGIGYVMKVSALVVSVAVRQRTRGQDQSGMQAENCSSADHDAWHTRKVLGAAGKRNCCALEPMEARYFRVSLTIKPGTHHNQMFPR